MAGDRVLRVVLVGSSKSAVKALGETEAATGTLGSKITSVAGKFKSVGKSLTSAGRSITHKVTLPVVAAGVAAIKMSTDFNSAMTRVQTQAGASAKDVDWLSKRVLNLSGKTQQSPLDLANSMYHLKSVGMGNVQAMKALRAATKLASVGNADMEETTNALAGAWRTGISGAKSFKGAIGTVNAIIGAGNMTLGDFNEALGTGILPSAKTFGLSLSQVGSALALFTDENVPANKAATRLRMSFSQLGAPSQAAEKQLKKIGLSGTALAKSLRKNGLIGAIGMLREHLKGLSKVKQTQLLSRAFGGGRSSSAILSMINNFDVLKKKQEQVTKSTGKFGAAFRKQSKTPQAQFKLLLSTIEMLAIKIGDKLLPFAIQAAQAFNRFIVWVSKLNPRILKMAGIFLGVVAAAGPLLMILGGIATGIAALASPVGLIILAVAALAAGFAYAMTHSKEFKAALSAAFAKIQPQVSSLVALVKGQLIPAFQKIMPVLIPVLKFLGGMFLDAVVGAVTGAIQVIKGLVQVISGVINLVDDLIHGRWSQVWHDLWTIVKGVFNILIGSFKVWWNVGILSIFKHGIFGILKLTKGGWKAIFGEAKGFMEHIGALLKGIVKLYTWPYRTAFKLTEDIVKTGWKYIRGDFSGGVGSIKAVLSRLVEVVTYPFRTAWNAVYGVVKGGIGRTVGLVKSVPGKIKAVFSGAIGWLKNAGAEIIRGLIAGIQSMASAAVQKVKDVGSSVIHAAKGIFHINSPSKVFHDIGSGLMEGLRNGVNSEHDRVVRLVQDLGRGMTGAFDQALNDPKVIHALATKFGDRLKAEMDRTKSKLSDLLSLRSDAISSVTGMQTTIFGNAQDDNGNATVSGVLAFAKAQEAQAKKVNKAIKRLTKMGLSKSLIKQFLNSGDSGLAQLFALMNGPKSAITKLNHLDKQTHRSLKHAGKHAGNYLYGDAIKGQRAQLRVEVKVASMIGEKDFAKKITPIIREELKKVGKRNDGKIFGT